MRRLAWFACPFWIGVCGLLLLLPGTTRFNRVLFKTEIAFLTLAYAWFLFGEWRRRPARRAAERDCDWVFGRDWRRQDTPLEDVLDRVWPPIDEDLRKEFRRETEP